MKSNNEKATVPVGSFEPTKVITYTYPTYEREWSAINILEIVSRAAFLGGQAAQRKRSELKSQLTHESKGSGGRDIVTEGDKVSQGVIIQSLRKADPKIAIVGEEKDQESNEHAVRQDKKWVLDPVDGTTNYSRGSDHWGTTVAYIEDGQVRAGAIYLPDHELLFATERGKGCFCNQQPLRLTPQDKSLKKSVVAMEWGFWLDEERIKKQSRIVTEARGTCGLLSAVYSITELLRGRADAYLNLHVPDKGASIWDFAAGDILLREATSLDTVSYFPDGSPVTWNQIKIEALFATSPPLAQEILTLIK